MSIVIAIWALGAVIISSVAMVVAEDKHVLEIMCFIAALWPIVFLLSILLSPILVGLSLGWMYKKRTKK